MKKLINTFIPILFYITIWAICPFGLFMRFAIGSAVYVFIEVMYDNTTDRWMAVMGGSLFVFCGSFDEWFMVPNLAYWFLIALTIVIIEYIGGRLVNGDFHIWDYRKVGITIDGEWIPLHFGGQVCLPFFAIWFFPIAPFLMWLDNILRFIFP